MPEFSGETYIDPRTDFGFKHLFGSEDSKEFLISFINSLLRGKHVVQDLEYLPTENLGRTPEARNSVFDVYCQGNRGEHFIVEMQNAFQPTFKSRSIYYSTFSIQKGVKKGSANFDFPPVYTICLLNFSFHEEIKGEKETPYLSEVQLFDVDTKTLFFDRLTYIYVELPKFVKTLSELDCDLDRWIFLLKNLSRLLDRPIQLQQRIFDRFFQKAQIKRLTVDQAQIYHLDSMSMVSFYEMLDYAKDRGQEQGREQGYEKGIEQGIEKGIEQGRLQERISMAKTLKTLGHSTEEIIQVTGLSPDDINSIK